MSIRAYAFDTSTGNIELKYESQQGSIEKVVFLSNKSFKVKWVGLGQQPMSGKATASKTNVKIGDSSFQYDYGWFAICRDSVSVSFTLTGDTSKSKQVDFAGLPTWKAGASHQEQGIDGRVIVQRPGISIFPIDVPSLAIGIGVGVTISAIAFFAYSNWIQ